MPLYLEIALALEQELQHLGANTLLPTEQQLAKRFSASRVTIRRALGLLERSGRITRQRGRGTIVSPPKVMRHMVPVCTIEQDLWEQGFKLETRVIEYQPNATPPPHIRECFRLLPDQSVGLLLLVRLVEDRIISHDQRYLPPVVAARFDPELIHNAPVTEVLQELAGEAITHVDTEMEITPAPPTVAAALGITPGVLVVINRFVDYLSAGQPIDAGTMSYRIDRVKFAFAAWGSSLSLRLPPQRDPTLGLNSTVTLAGAHSDLPKGPT